MKQYRSLFSFRLASSFFERVKKSKFAIEAATIFILSIVSKGFLFFGMAYAAKCLGPANLGVSAHIQTLVQQYSLIFNGGFDSVAVRSIAANKESLYRKLTAIIFFRFSIGLILVLGWLFFVSNIPDDGVRNVWFLGAILMLIGSLNTSFIFQAIEKLPLYTLIISFGSVVTALIFAFTFTEKMPLGSDLVVHIIVLGTTSIFALLYLLKDFRKIRVSVFLGKFKLIFSEVVLLLVSGWRYWIVAITIYIYSGFPLILITHYKGDVDSGIFRAGFMMASALELLFGSINSLLLPKLVQWNADSSKVLWANQTRLLFFHLVIGLVAGIGAILIAPFFFHHFLGIEYNASIEIFQILVIGRVFVFIGQIYAWGLVALHLDRAFLIITLGGASFSVVLNYMLIPNFGALAAAYVSVLTELVIHLGCYFAAKSHIKLNNNEEN